MKPRSSILARSINIRKRGARLSGGFTLMEMLVAMTLMSLLMLGMASSVRTMAQTEERIDLRVERADEMRVALGFVKSVLGRISMRKVNPSPSMNASPFLFAGEADSVTWLGVMPARFGAGGRHVFRLMVEIVGGEPALVIRFAPWTGGGGVNDWMSADSRVLVRGVTSLTFAYEDMRQAEPQWVTQWSRTDSLPAHVRINLGTQAGPWPLWIVATRTLPFGDRAGSSAFSSGAD